MQDRRKTRGRIAPWLLFAGLCLGLSGQGCSDADAVASMKTFPVKGSVKLNDGKPLTSGLVVFASPEKGLEFSSPVEDDGTFVLKSNYGDGAPEGTYKVRIERDPSKTDSQIKSGRKAAPAAPYPAKYGDENTSGLTAVVKEGDNALEPFVLSKEK